VPLTSETVVPGLDHVVLAGGTPAQWLAMTSGEWMTRLTEIARGAVAGSAHWVTVLPHHGRDFTIAELSMFTHQMLATNKVEAISSGGGTRFVFAAGKDLSVIVDPVADGHERFAAVVESLRIAGFDPDSVTENSLSSALLAPADQEADLVVVLGPPDRLPESMVWELAYSELVFIDIDWAMFTSSHLELAIDDFNRRHRRFGGLDS
jgi:undecaprenyl diphosphate synthase